uniref:Homeobox-leucine zipper family protein n=1 Tax=Rhizophora mucronata TaxID=61149 RepID=A0A2P2JGA4_RHIMU
MLVAKIHFKEIDLLRTELPLLRPCNSRHVLLSPTSGFGFTLLWIN